MFAAIRHNDGPMSGGDERPLPRLRVTRPSLVSRISACRMMFLEQEARDADNHAVVGFAVLRTENGVAMVGSPSIRLFYKFRTFLRRSLTLRRIANLFGMHINAGSGRGGACSSSGGAACRGGGRGPCAGQSGGRLPDLYKGLARALVFALLIAVVLYVAGRLLDHRRTAWLRLLALTGDSAKSTTVACERAAALQEQHFVTLLKLATSAA
jgi:hypothetical protein